MKKIKDKYNPLKVSYGLFGSKYKMEIIYFLNLKSRRFSEIKILLKSVTQQLLTKKLRELENNDLISRYTHKGYPRKVEYSISPFGKNIIPIINSIISWEKKNSVKISKLVEKNIVDFLYDYY